jgi:hypothetical protein
MVLRLLFTVHATLTVAAGIVLVIAPAAIPHAVGIIITPPAFLLCYLLAAAELCIGLISWGARNLTDTHAIRLIATSFIVFHGASALLEILAFMAKVSSGIWANVVVRFVAVALFSYYGLVRPEGAAVTTSEYLPRSEALDCGCSALRREAGHSRRLASRQYGMTGPLS